MYYVFIHGYCHDETFFEEFSDATLAAEYVKNRMRFGDKSSKYIVVKGERIVVEYLDDIDDVLFKEGKQYAL